MSVQISSDFSIKVHYTCKNSCTQFQNTFMFMRILVPWSVKVANCNQILGYATDHNCTARSQYLNLDLFQIYWFRHWSNQTQSNTLSIKKNQFRVSFLSCRRRSEGNTLCSKPDFQLCQQNTLSLSGVIITGGSKGAQFFHADLRKIGQNNKLAPPPLLGMDPPPA